MIEGIENAYPNYGLPKQKKYPLPDRKHVLSAIRFFNYVSPRDEKQLAEAILEKIKEYGMKDIGVGPDNRFLKYYKKDAGRLQHYRTSDRKAGESVVANFKITRSDELMHYRTRGSKNGVRLYQNPDGSLTPLGERRYRDMYGYGERNRATEQVARSGQYGRSVVVTPNAHKDVKGAPQGKVFRDTSMGPTLFKGYADDPNEVREIGTNYVTAPQIFGKYDSKKADLYEDPRNFQKTPGDKTAPMYKPREDVKEKLQSEYGNNIPRDQYEAYMVTPSKDDVYNKNGAHVRFGTTSLNRMNEARISNDKAKEKAAKEKAEKEKAESLSGRLQSAYNDTSKWVVERADDAKKVATDAYNSASKAVVDTADTVKKGASDAYDAASKAVADTADKVKKGASDAYDAASKAVVDAADKAKGALDQAYQDAEKWVTTVADDVKKTASEAFDAGKKWVEQAGKDVGDFVNSTVSDVTKAVDDAKNGVADAANAVGKAAQDGWNWVKNLFGGGDDYGKDKDKDRSNHSSSSHKM